MMNWYAADLKRHMEKMEVKPIEYSFTWRSEKFGKEGESYFVNGAGKCKLMKNEDIDVKKLHFQKEGK